MSEIRNIAIIAHVDHGKTTLVDKIIDSAKLFRDNEETQTCMLDDNDLERERGITILSKNISVNYKGIKMNVIDTPGHADFGGQVERVLKMADGVLLLVDAAEGPMPQTRFVLSKALQLGLKPVVFINKIDKQDARQEVILDMVFDLFVELDATDAQLDFPVLYGSGRDGYASRDEDGGSVEERSITPLMDAFVSDIPGPKIEEGAVQMQVTTLDYSEFVGRIGIGRVYRGTLKKNEPLKVIKRDGTEKNVKIKQLFVFEGLERKEVEEVPCGDLCAIVGVDGIDISDTITCGTAPEALPNIALDEPTISMIFRINDSPLFGQEGEHVTSRKIADRLFKETELDVALRVEEQEEGSWIVSGRGVLHLAVLIETMRREGYELSVSQPQVIQKEIDGKICEPIEFLTVDTPDDTAGKVIELASVRRGEMIEIEHSKGRQILNFYIPTRGMIGLRSRITTATAGDAIVASRFHEYAQVKGEFPHRRNGVMISAGNGNSEAFAIAALQLRGKFFIDPNVACYEGMVVGENSKEGDLIINLQKAKQLTNVRSSGTDKALKVAPAQKMSLEETLEYISDDELVEVTPENIRLRKIYLKEVDRKRFGRKK